jgi:isoaspartyl peptidase/L-asparaginase-like protein (Ntn-hydrolase superfamily)
MHVWLLGKPVGATEYARECGIELVPTESLLVGRELERFHEIQQHHETFVAKDSFRHHGHNNNSNTGTTDTAPSTYMPSKGQGLGTVGCVCMDQQGRCAVAVSTGGTPFKRRGRVGDTPLWGAGAYLNHRRAVAATGYGEDLYRVLACRSAVDFAISPLSLSAYDSSSCINNNNDCCDSSTDQPTSSQRNDLAATPFGSDQSTSFTAIDTHADPFETRLQNALQATIMQLQAQVNGLGGLIAIGPDGIALAWNTPRMAHAYRTDIMPAIVFGV